MNKALRNIVILGPQGSGKGTQAGILERTLNLSHIETGKIFREMARQNTKLGKKIHLLMNVKGQFLSSAFVIKILKLKLSKLARSKGFIFDGFPRNLTQAVVLDRLLRSLGHQLTHVIYLPVAKKTTIKRLALRRTCHQCNKIFILGKNLKLRTNKCPACGGSIYQREDDKPKAIAKRLALYEKQTKPLVRYYKKRGILITVDGEPPIPAVTKKILRHFIL